MKIIYRNQQFNVKYLVYRQPEGMFIYNTKGHLIDKTYNNLYKTDSKKKIIITDNPEVYFYYFSGDWTKIVASPSDIMAEFFKDFNL